MKMLFPKSVISYSYILDQYLSLKQSSQMCWFPWLCFLVLPNTSSQCFLNHPLPLHSLNTHEQHQFGPCGHTLFTCRPSPEEIIFRQPSNSSTRDLSFYAKLQFLISSSRHLAWLQTQLSENRSRALDSMCWTSESLFLWSGFCQ